ncbi:hypothetical protein LZ017_03210 [Pelomonas sp. CA6]|uniref:hypothetical protein n=1 Tax=Pelomonas sp. CA6 TaxID=2907999 RepID=UPI001F4A8D47|nr:hypothetical protein [Pelomonas sp. CA6]MCH7342388.1 hypothetical protein [Pelomonas sp. CA6]
MAFALNKRLLPVLLSLLASTAQASGAGPQDYFVWREHSDMPTAAVLRGEPGLLLPSFHRVHLYPGWRALASRDAALPLKPLSDEALHLACCDAGAATLQGADEPARDAIRTWLETRVAVQPQPPRALPSPLKSLGRDGWDWFLNCPDPAFRFASDTLAQLKQRRDATPERLRAWVQAQDQVFEHCASRGVPAPVGGKAAPQPLPEPPQALAASEALYWRQARDYQRAAAAFYAGDWASATPAFHRIAVDDGHPWQAWAALAELRSVLREASLAGRMTAEPRPAAQALLQRLRALAAAIAAHRDWGMQQRAAQDLIALAEARLVPDERFAALSAELQRLDQAPGRHALSDWVRLADARFDGNAQALPPARAAHPMLDWMSALQQCEPLADPAPAADRQRRAAAFEHALQRWQARPGALWLVPLLSCADGAALERQPAQAQALLKAVDALPADHPAAATLRWQQLRLLRELGQLDRARALLPALQALKLPSVSARNLIAQQALSLARNLDEARPWLAREWAGWRDADSGAEGRPAAPQPALAEDGARLITTRLSLAQWQALVEAPDLARELRVPLTLGLWWRAELLGQTGRAQAAARLLARLDPRQAATVRPYLAAGSAPARREALWRATLAQPLRAAVGTGLGQDVRFEGPLPSTPLDDAVASAWCRLDQADTGWIDDGSVERVPPLPPQFAPAPELAAEQAALKAQGSATGAFARWVLQRAQQKPAPADLDWLLYVGIQSTRGGCVDPDNGRQSQAMHRLLHQRFPRSPWAAQSPYWYR